MSSTNPFSRAFSIRDKRRGKNRNDCDFDGLFTFGKEVKKPSKEEEKKIEELKSQLESLGLTSVPDARIEYVVRAKGVDGDLKKAYRLLMLFEDSVAGVLSQPDPAVRMLGAENRERVTCWLDSLLFAMFANADIFEAILFNTFEDEHRQTLVTVLRVWVNLLRTGRLVTADITKHLQNSLAACGWSDAAKVRQQDASEAFGFITDRLNLPLVTLKTDLFHAGKEDKKDDHKFITERLLDVAIPENVPQDGVITLEQCLEEYFNNRVEVKRELQRRNTASRASIGSMEKNGTVHVEAVEVADDEPGVTPDVQENPKRPTYMLRDRATSIFSERHIPSRLQAVKGSDGSNNKATGRKRAESIKKEVLMPAWQFLNLIPWYTDNAMDDNSQLAAHFSSRRPMLGICLKRYKVSLNGTASRLNTKIDIPLEMASPHFADEEDDKSPSFKLVLQSVVCHRGTSVNAGHYIAMARVTTLSASRHGSISSGNDSSQTLQTSDTWLRMDDLAADRVATIDIQQALRNESPYLLFYRIQPLKEDLTEGEPPPYSADEASPNNVDEKLAVLPPSNRPSMDVPSNRPSIEIVESEAESRVNSPDSIALKSEAKASSKAGSIITDTASTAPVSPADEQKGNPGYLSKNNSSSGKSRRQSSDSLDRRLTSKIRSRLSKDRAARPDVTVDLEHARTGNHLRVEEPEDHAKGKLKRKDNKFSRSRRSSLNDRLKGGVPDRDCIVM